MSKIRVTLKAFTGQVVCIGVWSAYWALDSQEDWLYSLAQVNNVPDYHQLIKAEATLQTGTVTRGLWRLTNQSRQSNVHLLTDNVRPLKKNVWLFSWKIAEKSSHFRPARFVWDWYWYTACHRELDYTPHSALWVVTRQCFCDTSHSGKQSLHSWVKATRILWRGCDEHCRG